MSIFPLPVFEADADPHHREALSDEEIYARLEPPKTIVVRFGALKLVGEFPYSGDAKPGCGTKVVARTHRGTEIAEMLTTTCENAGCSKSVTRKEMLDYIDNSGGKEYPFHTNGRILRIATIEDLNKQSALDSRKRDWVKFCKSRIAEHRLAMKLVDVEPILGEELLTFYYMSEDRVDFRELVRELASEFKTRIEMRQVGARDEARLVADYEKCGQHCCCKNFLKVLKPISMRSAKLQKATLDPLKISGRCGRLMCCLRYEDQTYKELKANLPNRKKRVGTVEGPGIVVDSKVLVQLVLVRLEHDGKEIAVPVEELMDPEKCPKPGEAQAERERLAELSDPLRGLSPEDLADPEAGRKFKKKKGPRKSKEERQAAYREKAIEQEKREQQRTSDADDAGGGAKPKRKRRRRKSRKPGERQAQQQIGQSAAQSPPPRDSSDSAQQNKKSSRKKRPRRRRKGRAPGAPESGGQNENG